MRHPRQNWTGVVYHLISRFVDREWFIASEEERQKYLELLGHALTESDWRCLAYAVMSSHIHLAVVAGEEPLAAWLRRVHSPFATYINERLGRIGPIFVRGPKDYEVRPENEGNVIAYLHNNPVAAGLVSVPRKSNWTSHRAYVGMVRAPRWLHVTEGLQRAGFESGSQFDAWVKRTPGDPSIAELGMIRRAVRKRGAIEVATPRVSPTEVPLVARPWAHFRPDPRRIIELTAELTRLSTIELCSKRKNPTVVSARRVAVHSAIVAGLSGSDIAAAIGLSQQAASRLHRSEITPPEQAKRDAVLRRLLAA